MPGFLLLGFALGCAANIQALYDAEKAAALAPPPDAAASWNPEVRLRLSQDALGVLAQEAIDGGLLAWKKKLQIDNPLGIPISVTPKIAVDTLRVTPGQSCDACLEIDARLKGQAKWKAGELGGKVPLTARVVGTLSLTLEPSKSGWDLSGQVADVKKLKISAARAGKVDVTKVLKGWTKAALAQVPTLRFGRIGGGKRLPLRALRLASDAHAIEVQGLTKVSGGSQVAAVTRAPRSDWELYVSQDTVLALLRVTAFQQGPADHDVAADPRSLRATGERFDLGLRLWRLNKPGWWREYTVTGGLEVKKGKLKFRSDGAEEGEKSKGAGLADPLAALAEGKILDAVADGIRESVPAARSTKVQGMKIKASARSARGQGDALVLSGDFTVASK